MAQEQMMIKELLQTRVGTEGTTLIPTKIYDTLWDSVDKALIGRQFAAFIVGPAGVPGSSFDLNLANQFRYFCDQFCFEF